ncbi:MAG: hypothetical protein LUC91_00135 [Prevotella sp.]|nr:hypothetical protein [Prevotella sp.]
MAKADIKTCRYKNCQHESKQIDTSCEPYEVEGNRYYHKDCYNDKVTEEKREAKISADMQLIKNIWISNISNTVVYSQLFQVLNQFIRERGVDSEYMIFVVQYCIDHKLGLRHPYGLKYYVDRQDIKTAYEKKIKSENRVDLYSFETTRNDDKSPKFSTPKKPDGFSRILGGK